MSECQNNPKLSWVADKVESIDSKVDRLLEISVVNRAKLDWHTVQLRAIWVGIFTATGSLVAFLINRLS